MTKKETVLQKLLMLRAGLSYISQCKDKYAVAQKEGRQANDEYTKLKTETAEAEAKLSAARKSADRYDVEKYETLLDTAEANKQTMLRQAESELAEFDKAADPFYALFDEVNNVGSKLDSTEVLTDDEIFAIYDAGLFYIDSDDRAPRHSRDLHSIFKLFGKKAECAASETYAKHINADAKERFDQNEKIVAAKAAQIKKIDDAFAEINKQFERDLEQLHRDKSNSYDMSFTKSQAIFDKNYKKIQAKRDKTRKKLNRKYSNYIDLKKELSALQAKSRELESQIYDDDFYRKAITECLPSLLEKDRVYLLSKIDEQKKRKREAIKEIERRSGVQSASADLDSERKSKVRDLAELESCRKKYDDSKAALEKSEKRLNAKLMELMKNMVGATDMYKTLTKDYKDLLVPEQWENLDIVIYYIYNGYADTVKEALVQKREDDRTNQITDTIKQMESNITRTITDSFNGMRDIMVQGFTLMSHQLSAIQDQVYANSVETQRINDRLIDTNNNIDFSNSLLQKANASCAQLVSDANYMCSLASDAEVRRRNGLN